MQFRDFTESRHFTRVRCGRRGCGEEFLLRDALVKPGAHGVQGSVATINCPVCGQCFCHLEKPRSKEPSLEELGILPPRPSKGIQLKLWSE